MDKRPPATQRPKFSMTTARFGGMLALMRILLLLLSLLCLASPAAAADRRYTVTDFDRVIVEGPYSVRLTVGAPSSAVASGSPQALEAVAVDVQGMTLRIRRNRNAWGASQGRDPEPAVITLTTRSLRAASIIGSGTIELTGARGLRLDLFADGSSRLAARAVQADALWLGLRGSGSILVEGRAGTLNADIQGSGSLAARGLTAETARISTATSGEIAVTVRRSVTVTASGLGSVLIAGEPACVVQGPGAGQVRCGRAP